MEARRLHLGPLVVAWGNLGAGDNDFDLFSQMYSPLDNCKFQPRPFERGLSDAAGSIALLPPFSKHLAAQSKQLPVREYFQRYGAVVSYILQGANHSLPVDISGAKG
jgi:hypothetical protein